MKKHRQQSLCFFRNERPTVLNSIENTASGAIPGGPVGPGLALLQGQKIISVFRLPDVEHGRIKPVQHIRLPGIHIDQFGDFFRPQVPVIQQAVQRNLIRAPSDFSSEKRS